MLRTLCAYVRKSTSPPSPGRHSKAVRSAGHGCSRYYENQSIEVSWEISPPPRPPMPASLERLCIPPYPPYEGIRRLERSEARGSEGHLPRSERSNEDQ
jgi:hypothetical protein